MRGKRFLIFSALAFAVLLGLAWRAGLKPAATPVAQPGTTGMAGLWETRMADPAGQVQAFTQWRGKVLVVNFWAPWCPPCRAEMPGFAALQDKYGGRGVQFVGVALDEAENVRRFLQEFALNYPILLGGEPGYRLSFDLGNNTNSLPFTVVFDRQGRVVLRRVGYLDEEGLDGVLKSLL